MTFAVSVELNGTAIEDVTLEGVTIRYGRQTAYDQPDPTTCSIRLVRDSTLGTVNVNDVAIGSTLRVAVTPTGQTEQRRFFGIVTDVSTDNETVTIAGTATGLYSMRQLTYIAPGYNVFDADAGTTLAATYVLALGAFIPDVNNKPTRFPDLYGETYAGQYLNIAYKFEALDELDVGTVMDDAAAATIGGVLRENMLKVAGKENIAVTLASYKEREDLTADVTLTSSEVTLTDWRAARELGSYATAQTVSYVGPYNYVAQDFDQPGEATRESDLIDTFGPFTRTQNLPMTSGTQAAALCLFNITCTEWPGWLLDVTLPLASMTAARQVTICTNALVSKCWHTPSLATGLPTKWFCEGYTETISRNDWVMALRLSDTASSGVGQQWNQVTAALIWNNVDATTRWVDLKNEDL